MGRKIPAVINRLCQYGSHETCSHKFGAGMSLTGRNRQPMALLCTCSCHDSCPLGGQRKVPNQEWLDGCTCPGSQRMRDIEQRVDQETEARKARDAEVLRDVQVGRGRSAEEIQQEILVAYQAHGYEPPSDFSRWSRFIAAGTARRGTRTVRLVGEAVSGVRAARRWTPESTDQDFPVPDRRPRPVARQEARNKAELRKLGLAAAGYGAVAGAAVAGAYCTSGTAHVALAAVAALFAAIAAWVTLWYIGIDILVHIARNIDRRG
jgi:hypothetical protein